MPTTSVVIPTYNRCGSIERAISSVLSQTVDDFEIIVVDDGSDDDTVAVVESYADDRVQLVRHEQNRGANAARNSGVKHASGEYISFLDSDDELHPEHLARVRDRLAESTDQCVGAFTSFERLIDGTVAGISRAPDAEVGVDYLSDGNAIGTLSCTTFESQLLEAGGWFDEQLLASQDLDFYLRVLESNTMVGIDEVLVSKHVFDENIGSCYRRKRQGFDRVLEKHEEKLSNAYISHQYRVLGRLQAQKGNMLPARTLFRKSMAENRYNLGSACLYLLSFLGRDTLTYGVSKARRGRRVFDRLFG
ncbi:glycosyltransferase family 2 protein [Haloarchaeobius sp. HRN-SO-5]|uniref:glycosyltransferase family 2 protein n=1 Tax=Haloarchaeobius sp. HRN-SO-5 TaxID=3446118 RepID=UPI003EC13D5E